MANSFRARSGPATQLLTGICFFTVKPRIAPLKGWSKQRGKPEARLSRDALFFHYPHYCHVPYSTPAGAVRVGDWKLLELFEDQRVELFDLKDDPGERRDLADQLPDKAAELRQRLRDWRTSVGAQMPSPNPSFRASDRTP